MVTVQIKGIEDLDRKFDAIKRAGKVADATFVWAQSIAIEDRRRARAKPGRSFWVDQAKRIIPVHHGLDGAAVKVGIEGLHHHTGGDIFPSTAKCLTIPIAPEAKGKRAREFEQGGRDLFVLESDKPDTTGVLGYAEDDGDFHALYVLRSKVHHEPAPWLVEGAEALRIGERELAAFAKRMVEAG